MSTKNPFPFDCWPQQSPIDLFHADALHVAFPSDYLGIDYSTAPYTGQFKEDNHHWNFVLDPIPDGTPPPLLTLGGVTAELKKIHLHTPSEHDLEGEDQDGEIHLIHQINDPQAGSVYVVLGVFFSTDGPKRGAKADADLSAFYSAWATEAQGRKRAGGGGGAVTIDPRRLLPKTDKWFRYEGSLTTEPYSEIVSWVVFRTPLGITSDDLKKLRAGAHQPERDTQPLNRRFVLRNFK